MVSIQSTGYTAWIVHPTTDRILPVEVLDDPEITPSLNALPWIRVPVPENEQWQKLTGLEPEFNVYNDGAEQPIDELVKVRDNRERVETVLEGRGGIDLLDVVTKEFDNKRRHEALREIIQNDTPYDDDVDTPNPPILTDQPLQLADTTTEWNNITDALADTDPITISSGEFQLAQSLFFGRTDDLSGGEQIIEDGDDDENWDDADAMDYNESSPLAASLFFTPPYTIPEENVGVAFRFQGDWPNGIDLTVNGQNISPFNSIGEGASPVWYVVSGEDSGFTGSYLHFTPSPAYSNGDLTANTQFEFEFNAAGDNTGGTDTPYLDCLVVFDDRFEYDFDNTTDAAALSLDGPETHPDAFEFEFPVEDTAFAYIKLSAVITMLDDDTSNDQRLQVSGDGGNTWLPDDGSEDNTESVTIDPLSPPGASARWRVRLSRYEPNGIQTDSPRLGYDGQRIDDVELRADVEQTALLLDYAVEQSIVDHFNDIAGGEFIWSYRIVDGTKTVTVTEPGQRSAADTPDLIEAEVSKDFEQYHRITVRGANKRVTGEEFTASTSFTNLTNDDILPGSEAVVDPDDGTNYTRGTDYEVSWQDGEIRILSAGAMVSGDTYAIDYQHEVSGTHVASPLPSNFKSRIVDIPGVTSDRNAEQIAYVLVEIEGFDQPRYVADILIPPGETTFDAIESISVDALPKLPSDVGSLEVEEQPAVTPRGTAFRLGSRSELEARVRELRERVRQVSRRSG